MKTRKLIYAGVLTALGIILPQAFHVFGPTAGVVFLPMHIPVILAGFLAGPFLGGIVGIIVPVISFLIYGMPAIPRLYFMIPELFVYAFVAGLLYKKLNIYLSLIISMIAGRVFFGLSLVITVFLLGIRVPFGSTAAFIGTIITGVPGMLIQILIIPLLIFALKKGGLIINEKH